MLNIGLLITRNEADIIQFVLDSFLNHLDTVFALDCSSDETTDILHEHDIVEDLIVRDPDEVHRDGVRRLVLQRIKERYQDEGWISVLHGDEIFYDNPRKAIERAEREGKTWIIWQSIMFWLSPSKPFALYNVWVKENRQFKNLPGIYFDINCHHRTIPFGLSGEAMSVNPLYFHLPYRSEEQVRKRALDRVKRGFQPIYRKYLDNPYYTQGAKPLNKYETPIPRPRLG